MIVNSGCVWSGPSSRDRWLRRLGRSVLGLAGLTFMASCVGSGQLLCRPDPITGSQTCQAAGGDATGAAITTGAAAVLYAGVGCTWNGCTLPDRCNPKTKRCETITCSETRDCPSGYSCDLSTHLCR
jgi:hypothetical protein